MPSRDAQLALFDAVPRLDGTPAEADAAAAARGRMRAMIERLRSAVVPPWKDEMAAILDDGAFQRAMHYVPDVEGKRLWAEYDAQAERLFSVLVDSRAA